MCPSRRRRLDADDDPPSERFVEAATSGFEVAALMRQCFLCARAVDPSSLTP